MNNEQINSKIVNIENYTFLNWLITCEIDKSLFWSNKFIINSLRQKKLGTGLLGVILNNELHNLNYLYFIFGFGFDFFVIQSDIKNYCKYYISL